MDQGLSSISNFGVAFLAAHNLSASGFGAFTLPFLAYTLALGTSGAIAATPFLVRFSHEPLNRSLRSARRSTTGASLAIALGCGLLLLAIAPFTTHILQAPFIVVALSLPGLLLQDTVRQLYFADGHPNMAALNDGIWVIVSAVAIIIAHQFAGLRSPAELLFLWSVGAWIAAVIGILHLRALPRILMASSWIRKNWSMGFSFFLDFLSMNGASQLVFYVLPVLVGLQADGSLRGAQLIFGPLTVLQAGSRVFGIPEGVRLRPQGPCVMRKAALIFGAALSAIALLYWVGIQLIPQQIGHALLGSTWQGASQLIPFVGLALLGSTVALAPYQGLRVLASGRRILRARAIDAPLTVLLSCGGAFLGGALGAAMGWALANCLAAGAWWYQFGRACQEFDVPNATIGSRIPLAS